MVDRVMEPMLRKVDVNYCFGSYRRKAGEMRGTICGRLFKLGSTIPRPGRYAYYHYGSHLVGFV